MKPHQKIAFAALASAASCAHAVLPVTDYVHIGISQASWAKQAADMVTQITKLKEQLTQAQQTYSAMTGSRGMSSLLQNPGLYNYLPPDVAAALKANGAGLASATAIKADLKLFDIGQSSIDPNSATGKNFVSRQSANANYQVLNDQGYAAAADRVKQLNAMTQSIDGATDPAAIAALQARISAEQGLIANEQAKLTLLAQMAANEDRIREQQAKEIAMKATRGTMPAGW